MIEVTDEMVTAAAEVAEDEMVRRLGRDLGTLHRDDIIRAALKAALAIVERDWNMQPNPNARKSRPGRGVNHPHYCLSCSNGEAKGPGCMNCRQTGFDQTPWPSCAGCPS